MHSGGDSGKNLPDKYRAKIGRYVFTADRDLGNEYIFRLFKHGEKTADAGTPEDRLYAVFCDIYGSKAVLGKLFRYIKSGELTRALELDVLRFGMEEYLYQRGVRNVSGKTNPRLANAMHLRGWNVSGSGSTLQISKRLSPESNPVPVQLIRENRKRLAKRHQPGARKREKFRIKPRRKPSRP